MKNVFSRRQMGIPYGVFLAFFVAAPLIVLFYYAFTNGSGQFTLNNLKNFFGRPQYNGDVMLQYCTGGNGDTDLSGDCLSGGVYFSGQCIKKKGCYSDAFVLPMWINFTLRITALKEILSLIEGNLAFHPFLNTVIGMTYDFLPFMILPLYTTLSRLDSSLIEAAGDLGADSFQTFIKVIFPAVNSWNCQRVCQVFYRQ